MSEYTLITQMVDLPGYQVVKAVVKSESIDLWLEPEERFYTCGYCGQRHFALHSKWEVTIRDLPAFGKKVYLHLSQWRVECSCRQKPVKAELGIVAEGHRVSKRLARQVHQDCGHTAVKHVAEYYGLGWEQVKRIDKDELERQVDRFKEVSPTKIAIDEYALSRGHKYLTIITELELRRVIEVAKTRQSSAVGEYLRRLGKRKRARIRDAVIDMWSPYEKALRRYCPQARITYDRFHVVRELNRAVDEVRREEQQRYSKEGKHLLKGSRFLLLKGEERLSPASRAQLSELLSLNENLFKAYLLKEEFRQLYRLRDENLSDERRYREGFRRFIRWAEKVKESGLESFRRVLKTFTRRLWGILNFLRTGLTNGLSEGLNNAIATLKKMAYGYRDEEYFILKIYQRAGLI